MSKKTDLPVDKIEQLSKILKDQDLTEIEVEIDDFKIKVRKESGAVSVAAPIAAAPVAPTSNGSAPAASAPAASDLYEVKSPMVGTFYAKPSPDAEPFIKVGDKVKKGDVLCIVEAMKLMNELPAEVDGEIAEICVSDAEAISFGQVIIKIKE